MANAVTVVDGSTDFSGGVDSIKVSTVQSPSNPNGLARNELAWLVNGTVRDGGILQRTGWKLKGTIHDGSALFQDISLYEPDYGTPYFVAQIGGRFYKVDPDFASGVVDLSAASGITNPPTQPYPYMCQAEQFLIIQAGDYGTAATPTLPVFWDGNTLRRSHGLAPAPGQTAELPAAGPMDYYQGRVWYGQGRVISAGDIVYDTASGTAAYAFRDSVLKVTENPLAIGGDGFHVPTNAGNIRAIKHSANLDTTLGQGNLFIGTSKSIYSLNVPITRTDWIAANNTNQPLMTVVQINNGMVNDRSVVAVNGDLFFQSLEPSIRSLISAIRYFGQWSNPQISANEERILAFNDRALMRFATGIQYDNRLLQAVLPKQTPQGVVHTAIIPLDFTPISSFGSTTPPSWEGHYEGLQVLKLLTGDFGGLERAFAVVVSQIDSSIQLWELTNADRYENADPVTGIGKRVTWQAEFPAFNFGKPFDLKELVTMELWVDKLFGPVDYVVDYRPDGDPCWHFWSKFRMCTARNSAENVSNPTTYPLQPYRESYRATITLPKPPNECESVMLRPVNKGYQFQARITITGWCRIRGMLLHALPLDRTLYENMVCTVKFASENEALPPVPPIPPLSSIVVIADPPGNLIADPQGNILQGF